MNRQSFLNLISREGLALLESVGDLESKTDVLKLVSDLRKQGHDPDLVGDVLTQVKLRRKAEAKFGDFAKGMIFTQSGLEQASRLQVAAIHAGRFRNAGLNHIADLGCGIGAETLALASLDLTVSAFELDEVTAAVATYNLATFSNVTVEQEDVTKLELSKYDGLFLDPARRDERKRKFDPIDFTPNYGFVLETARTKPTIVKLGPGMDHDLIPDNAEAVWVSVDGELVEVSLYFGKVKRADVARAALLINSTGFHELTSPNKARSDADLGELGEYIYEPDNSIIRSHLIGDLANQFNLKLIANEIAYLTGDSVDSPWLKKYKLIDSLPFDRKKLKAYLKGLDIGPLEIKKRGADITPEQLRRELNLKGSKPATIIVTRVQDQHRVLVVEPVKQ